MQSKDDASVGFLEKSEDQAFIGAIVKGAGVTLRDREGNQASYLLPANSENSRTPDVHPFGPPNKRLGVGLRFLL